MFIDQLGMIQEKTRGNLTNEEATVLRNTLSNLQMAFVEVSQATRGGGAPAAEQPSSQPAEDKPEPAAESSAKTSAETPDEPESRKKFTKSYGA